MACLCSSFCSIGDATMLPMEDAAPCSAGARSIAAMIMSFVSTGSKRVHYTMIALYISRAGLD